MMMVIQKLAKEKNDKVRAVVIENVNSNQIKSVMATQ